MQLYIQLSVLRRTFVLYSILRMECKGQHTHCTVVTSKKKAVWDYDFSTAIQLCNCLSLSWTEKGLLNGFLRWVGWGWRPPLPWYSHYAWWDQDISPVLVVYKNDVRNFTGTEIPAVVVTSVVVLKQCQLLVFTKVSWQHLSLQLEEFVEHSLILH